MHNQPTTYLSDGRPAGPILTPDEVVDLLRLRECGSTKPEYLLQRLKDSGKLQPVRITRMSAYRLSDVLQYIEDLP